MEMSKTQPGMVLGNLLRVTLREQGLAQVVSRGPCQPQELPTPRSYCGCWKLLWA